MNVTEAFGASVTVAFTSPAPEAGVAPGAVQLVNVIPPGCMSVTGAAVTADGPLFATVTV